MAPVARAETPPGRVELVGSRTENAKFFRESDGTKTAEISPGPIHFRDGNGSWQDIDPTLVPSDRSGFETAADYVKAYYSSRYVGQKLDAKNNFISGWVDHPPANVDIDADSKEGTLTYTADTPTLGMGITVMDILSPNLRMFASATGIPASFTATRNDTSTSFDAATPISTIKFRASNNGTPANRSGSHILARNSAETGKFNVSAYATDVTKLSYTKSGENLSLISNVNLHGQPFVVDVLVDGPAPNSDYDGPSVFHDEFRLFARGTISTLPSSLTFKRNGNKIEYDANANLNAKKLEVQLGWIKALAAAATPPGRNGVSVTDGTCSAGTDCDPVNNAGQTEGFCDASRNICKAIRLLYNFNGMGKTIDANLDPNNGLLDVTDLSASGGYFEAYAELDQIITNPIRASVKQEGLVSDTDLHFGPIKLAKASAAQGGGGLMSIHTRHSRNLGRLSLNLALLKSDCVPPTMNCFIIGDQRFSQLSGSARLSNIPQDADIDISYGREINGALVLSSSISTLEAQITAKVEEIDDFNRWISRGNGSASVRLTSIPASTAQDPITFSIEQVEKPSNDPNHKDPTMVPTAAVHAPGMSLAAHVDSLLQKFANSVVSVVVSPTDVAFKNLGTNLNMSWNPSTREAIILSTGGSTSEIYVGAQLSAEGSVSGEKAFTARGWRVTAGGSIGVTASAPSVAIHAYDVATLTMKAADTYMAYGVEGDYDHLTVKTPGLTVNAQLSSRLKIQHWPYWSWLPKYDKTINLNGTFNGLYGHVLKVGESRDTSLCIEIPWSNGHYWSAAVQTNPGRLGPRTKNSVSVDRRNGERQVFSLIDPGIASAIVDPTVDIVTAVWLNPFGNGSVGLREPQYDVPCPSR